MRHGPRRCPDCELAVERGLLDEAGRWWHHVCARRVLAQTAASRADACPRCVRSVHASEAALSDLRHGGHWRRWHFHCGRLALAMVR